MLVGDTKTETVIYREISGFQNRVGTDRNGGLLVFGAGQLALSNETSPFLHYAFDSIGGLCHIFYFAFDIGCANKLSVGELLGQTTFVRFFFRRSLRNSVGS